LTFHKGELFYIHLCKGNTQLFETETVEVNTKTHPESDWTEIWRMSCFGKIKPQFQQDAPLIKQTYEFLRQALSKISSDIPFRGPSRFPAIGEAGDRNWIYRCDLMEGPYLTDFNGTESIEREGKGIIYTGNYHGGLIIP